MRSDVRPEACAGGRSRSPVNSRGPFPTEIPVRGIDWAVTFQDPATGLLSNHWITLHDDGAPAGPRVVLVMDAWEHAFVPDDKPTERAKYVEAYFGNIDWSAVEKRVA